MRRVLLVDDSKATREALQAALEPYGFEVAHADNGASALLRLRESPYDLAFVDINMPVLDGPALVRLMRSQQIPTKVILVTAGASTHAVSATIRTGASDFVAKPFIPEAIRLAVARVLELDLSALQLRISRVLLQHPGDDVSSRLRVLLPPHVELTAAPVLVKVLEAAEREVYDLVLLDAEVLEGEVNVAAELVRLSLPDAAIFAVAREARPEDHWAPAGSLDGILPAALDEELVRGFLYPNFLRPLVFTEGTVLRVAGFEGSERDLNAYFAALSRALRRRAARLALGSEPTLDLTRVPPFPGRVASLIVELRDRLDALGTAPSFRVPRALVEKLTARPELKKAVVFA